MQIRNPYNLPIIWLRRARARAARIFHPKFHEFSWLWAFRLFGDLPSLISLVQWISQSFCFYNFAIIIFLSESVTEASFSTASLSLNPLKSGIIVHLLFGHGPSAHIMPFQAQLPSCRLRSQQHLPSPVTCILPAPNQASHLHHPSAHPVIRILPSHPPSARPVVRILPESRDISPASSSLEKSRIGRDGGWNLWRTCFGTYPTDM